MLQGRLAFPRSHSLSALLLTSLGPPGLADTCRYDEESRKLVARLAELSAKASQLRAVSIVCGVFL